ncbi:MAG: hypothetical protein RRB13_09810 [bacterium]|nr:hypothetical protein [bacterium]
MFKIFITSLLALSLSAPLMAAVPNSFTDGEVVSAAKVNANFAQASKKIVAKLDGAVIGTLLGITGTGAVVFLSDNLYAATIGKPLSSSPSLVQQETFYTAAGCTGTAYAGMAGTEGTVLYGFNGNLYHVNRSATYEATSAASAYGSGGCFTPSPVSVGYPLTAHDSSVTGFPSTLATGTLSLQVE